MFRDRDSWRVRWSEGGKSRSKSFPTKQDAALFEAQLKKGVSDVRTLEQERTTFAEWAEKWFRVYAKVEKSESTWSNDLAAIENHLNPIIGHLPLFDISDSHAQELKAAMTEKGRKPKTINNVMQLAKGILNLAVDYKLLRDNPWRRVKNLKLDELDFRYWTVAESDRFLEVCWQVRPELAELVQIAIHTGLRWGELHALMRKDIDFDTGYLTVQRTYSAKLKKILNRTKNKRVRRVEMSPEVVQIMKTKALMLPEQFIFRRPLINHAREYIRAMCVRAGVPVLGVHDLRHTCASQLVMAGVPLLMVSKHLGHRDTRVTERYAHLSPDSLRGITKAFSRPHLVREHEKKPLPEKVSL